MRTSNAALAAAALLLGGGVAEAADELTLQLKWVTQAQFGGYYVAKEKGFYDEVDLDVTILPGGPDIAPPQVIAGGGADVIIEWMPAALASREKGVPLVNIAQIFDRSGMMLTCLKETGIAAPEDFRGHTLGVWFFGNEYPFLSWMSQLGIPTQGGQDGVTVLKQGFNVDPLLQKQADCISTMTYNEYWQVIDAGLTPEDLVVFPYEDQGVATLEDGLYVLESSLEDEAMVDRLARFLEASIRGWEYAALHPDEAADIVLENDETGAQTEKHQRRMMGEINKLVGGGEQGIGFLDPADYQRTVDVLLAGGSDPVITAAPEGAWTHKIWEAIQYPFRGAARPLGAFARCLMLPAEAFWPWHRRYLGRCRNQDLAARSGA
jgi:NitT/TauT family transport system substrate-binding protein